MAQPHGLKAKPNSLPQFTDLKPEPRRTKIQKKLPLKLFGSLVQGRLVKPREYEMILKKTLESICILTIYPNTTTSVILLPCAINAACAALVDAGIPLRHLAVAICCCVTDNNSIILDPSKQEEKFPPPNSHVWLWMLVITEGKELTSKPGCFHSVLFS
ncbi:hypothetical protein KIW84_034095 [Lathyrus oleraceus]|uniref:Uncharacterized protein n=1 Tax=Pisum sativum TaxID=3888 RepID=A0A9D4XXN4_PEA|nr:hypothetical protein KIW84_034095 [Pisum sativum]